MELEPPTLEEEIALCRQKRVQMVQEIQNLRVERMQLQKDQEFCHFERSKCDLITKILESQVARLRELNTLLSETITKDNPCDLYVKKLQAEFSYSLKRESETLKDYAVLFARNKYLEAELTLCQKDFKATAAEAERVYDDATKLAMWSIPANEKLQSLQSLNQGLFEMWKKNALDPLVALQLQIIDQEVNKPVERLVLK
jgi:hypothetical protein